MNLFEYQAGKTAEASRPLAEKMRPSSLFEFIGQEHITGKGTLIRHAIENDQIFSMILWGPPGCGKTTLAGILANETQSSFIHFSAVLSGMKEIRGVIASAKETLLLYKKKTILFVDEIHRFNKSQQDAFLPNVESGLITLIGATTQNPSFEVIPALMSRCRVLSLKRLDATDIEAIIQNALTDQEKGIGSVNATLDPDALAHLVRLADGDARAALNNLEAAAALKTSRPPIPDGNRPNKNKKEKTEPKKIDPKADESKEDGPKENGVKETRVKENGDKENGDKKTRDEKTIVKKNGDKETGPAAPGRIVISLKDIERALEKKAILYDKTGEEHYNVISAFHKSLRGSDPDAAIYWLARMLAGGEDPFYIARRMVRFASEDIGNADPGALGIALSAMESFRFLGFPEGELALAQAAVYLATAPKSNAIYTAYKQTKQAIAQTGGLPVPLHIRNAPTRLMKQMDYGKGYKYAHDYKDAFVPQDYLPDKLRGTIFYNPTERGYEKEVKHRLTLWRRLKAGLKKKKKSD